MNQGETVDILLLEDDPAHAEAVQRAFPDSGMKAVVHVAQNLRDYRALAAVQTPDIAIVDLHLPDGNAMDVLTSPPEASPFPILIITGYGDEQVAVKAMKAGAIDYVEKSSGAFAAIPNIVERSFREWNMLQTRKRAEEALRESATCYLELFEAESDAIFLIENETGRVLEANSTAARMYGYDREELLTKKYVALSAEPEETQRIIRETPVNPDQVVTIPLRFHRKKDGTVFPVEITGRFFTIQGRPVHIVIIRDITDRKQAEAQRDASEKALRQEKENFQHSLDDSPLGVRIVTADGDTLYANQAILEMYNYDSLEELRNTPVEKRYTQEGYVEFQKRMKIRKSGDSGPLEYEISIVRKNGEVRHLQVFRKEILWYGKKQFQLLYRDITEDKKREKILREFEKTIQGQKLLLDQQSSSVEELIGRLTHSREALEASYEALKANKDDLMRSEKLAFTGRIAAGIAHEIRNPLTNVILAIRQLKKEDKIKPEGLKYSEIVERNTNRIEYLITELLNCARPIKLNLQPWDVHLIMKDVLNVHKVRLKTQRIKVMKNLTPHPSILLVDKEYLGRVFLNIIDNAIDAMPPGGALSITTKKEKGHFLIKIQDNGRGIPEKNLIKIFDPFFSTKKRGAGLGLTTCQNIVASHGGMIEVESAWRKGSSFSVSLPLEPKPSDRKENIEGES